MKREKERVAGILPARIAAILAANTGPFREQVEDPSGNALGTRGPEARDTFSYTL